MQTNSTLAFWNCLRSLHPDPHFRYWTQKETFFAMKTFWRRIKCVDCQKMTISLRLRRFDDFFWFFFEKDDFVIVFKSRNFARINWLSRNLECWDKSCNFTDYWASKQSSNKTDFNLFPKWFCLREPHDCQNSLVSKMFL